MLDSDVAMLGELIRLFVTILRPIFRP
ncbi:MAG: hypothetical protein RLZZ170_1283, partial [Actinomycetota bacterium]